MLKFLFPFVLIYLLLDDVNVRFIMGGLCSFYMENMYIIKNLMGEGTDCHF